ncbi:MAG: hypothetical protein K6E51_02895 [Treponema sp.]|nr:hypothetical protein [Treponema sp.]
MTKLQQIINGYKNLLYFIFKILMLLALCLVIGSIIVLPLWYFATKAPSVYTTVVFILITLFCGYRLYRICKKTPKAVLLRRIFQILILIATLTACVACVFAGHRILCIPVLLVSFLLFGLCTFAYREH